MRTVDSRHGPFTILSLAEIEDYGGQGPGRMTGKHLRFYCPLHGGDNQRSFSVHPKTGWFRCFRCEDWGLVEDFAPEDSAYEDDRGGDPVSHPGRVRWTPPPEPRPDLEKLLPAFQEQLRGRMKFDVWAREYIERRGVSVATALRLGVGFARPADTGYAAEPWPHVGEGGDLRAQSRWGRVVFPLTDPDGRVINLYGRAVATAAGHEGGWAHAKLPGPQGVFNGAALRTHRRVYLCEGPFDALSLAEIGIGGAVAVLGLGVSVWAWLREAREVVLALDADEPGREAAAALARSLKLRGKRVFVLPQEAYGGEKDLNAALADPDVRGSDFWAEEASAASEA